MIVINSQYCARCAGFELDKRKKISKSQIFFFFFNESYKPKVELNSDIVISLGETWPLEIFDLKITLVVNNLH